MALRTAAKNRFVHFHGVKTLGFGASRLHAGLYPVFNGVSDDI